MLLMDPCYTFEKGKPRESQCLFPQYNTVTAVMHSGLLILLNLFFKLVSSLLSFQSTSSAVVAPASALTTTATAATTESSVIVVVIKEQTSPDMNGLYMMQMHGPDAGFADWVYYTQYELEQQQQLQQQQRRTA